MIGYRTFGKNEGGLNHAGDFPWLFAPLQELLSSMAVYGLSSDGLCFPFYSQADDIDEAEKKVDELFDYLDSIEICPRPRPNSTLHEASYYRPGLFPKFSPYIRDDWNFIVCYKAPFPDYDLLLKADDLALLKQPSEIQMQAWFDTDFQFLLRNYDACYWEVFSPNSEAIDQLLAHFRNHGIDFHELLFEIDFPESSMSLDRKFKDIHPIWSPSD